MERSIRAKIEDLAQEFERAFPARLDAPRTVGREAEYPIVTVDGAAADVAKLWPLLLASADLQPKYDAVNADLIVGLEGTDYIYALEVGRGTIEISTRPCTHLLELQQIHHTALHHLIRAADHFGWRVLGYGIQPLDPPSLELLAPKQRYGAMFTAMGDDWLWYTVTASEQLHVDVARPEMVRLLNYGLLMAPVVIAFCGNSPVSGGAASGLCSTREGVLVLQSQYSNRHGLPEQPYTDLVDFIERLSQLPFLLRREGAYLLPDSRSFTELIDREEADFDAFLLHDHYVWHSARLRVAHATLELRPACQQPPGEEMAAAALYLGLVEAMEPIERHMQEHFGADRWLIMRDYHRRAIEEGLAAREPASGFLTTVLELADSALQQRGFGEEGLLAPLWQRLISRENPAQRARRLFQEEGLTALVNALTLTS